MRKEDAVLNMLINRACQHEDLSKRLDEMQNYFVGDLPRLASFFGERFGFKVEDWEDWRRQITASAQYVESDDGGYVSVGSVLAYIRRYKSRPSSNNSDRDRKLTNELVRPRRKKHK